MNAGASSRIGYRWLNSRQAWLYDVNAGVDTRPAYWQYAFQAGLGAEALSRSMEFRLNGYIPFAHTNELYATGWTDATLTADAKDAVTQAECNFLDLRGLPVVREGDVRLDSVQVTVPDALAINPATGQPWVVRCTETTSSSYSVTCANAPLDAMLAAAGAGDVLLAGGGASADLSTRPPVSGQPTLQLAANWVRVAIQPPCPRNADQPASAPSTSPRPRSPTTARAMCDHWKHLHRLLHQ